MSRLCQSQPNPAPSVQYHWLVIFDWDIHNPRPFLIDVGVNFTDTIPESWFRKKWPEHIRQQKVQFDAFPERVFSVFAKVEKGNYGAISVINII